MRNVAVYLIPFTLYVKNSSLLPSGVILTFKTSHQFFCFSLRMM